MSNGIPVESIDERVTRHAIRERLDSKDYWIFPWIGAWSLQITLELELTHYHEAPHEDFEVLLLAGLPVTIPAVVFARKARMSPEALSTLIKRVIDEDVPPDVLRERDVLWIERPEEKYDAAGAIMQLGLWLYEENAA